MPDFKKGALPRDDAGDLREIEDFITGRLPAVPDIIVDRATGDLFKMYLNDKLGDCTVADMLNLHTAVSDHSGEVRGGVQFSDEEAQTVYSAVAGYVPGDPSTDRGSTLRAVSQYGVSTGFTDTSGKTHKIAGWAEVRGFDDLDLLRQLVWVFGAVYLGVEVDDTDMAATDAHRPWTLPSAGTNVGPDGIDHCVALVLSGDGVAPASWDETGVATWGRLQKMDEDWATTNIGEAVVIVTEDWIQKNGTTIDGFNLTQLIADTQDGE